MSIRIYRMTHIDNIPHILTNGITHKTSPNRNPNYVGIGSVSIINTRDSTTCSKGRNLGDYIPFYFWYKSPMLLWIQTGYGDATACPPEEIVYMVLWTQSIINVNLDYIFTDAHAVSGLTRFYDSSNIQNIQNILDWEAVRSTYWGGEENRELKLKKEAEFLVYGDIPYNAIAGFVVYNEAAKQRLVGFGIQDDRIAIRTNYYF